MKAEHKIIICPNCGKEFEQKCKTQLYCKPSCREEYLFKQKQEELRKGVEGVDYVVDRWNGLVTPRIYGVWMRNMHPDRTLDEYKKEFPEAPLYCENDYKNTSKNSGKHMKNEKYKKMFSEKFKGEKNPMHKSKHTEQELKENSPFSKYFYIKRGYSEEEAENKVHEFAKESLKDRIGPTQIEYYLNQGMSEEDAKEALSERQRTFTLDKCIEKYGKEEGERRFYERQRKWSEKVEGMYKQGLFSKIPKKQDGFSSNLEKEFISNLLNETKIESKNCFSCVGNRQFFVFDNIESRCYAYDFCYKNKIIEFNGDFWHYNPETFKDKDSFSNNKMKAEERWAYDKKKKQYAESLGFDVLVVWENDYKKNKESVIAECKEFLEK